MGKTKQNKKTRKYGTMKRMLSLRDQRLKPKTKKRKIPAQGAHLTTSWLIPTLSTFPLKINWT
uniref:Uncharacterized protein n=1 Tax=Microcebus murinus TaxID=30608 RepID=A0A8C5XSK7_MICMU